MSPAAFDDVVEQAVTASWTGDPDDVAVAIHEGSTGDEAVVNGNLQVYGASLLKLLILRAIANRHLSAAQTADAKAMVERSDNDAATRLWRAAGENTAMSRQVSELGLVDTVTAPIVLEPWDGWVTTAPDQLRVLETLLVGPNTVDSNAVHLMTNVEPDQRWGVGAIPTSEPIAVKNGWLPLKGDTDWVVSTVGCIDAASANAICIAILSRHNPTLQAGTDAVTAVARAVFAASASTNG